jgi:response regulator of citrate/malate metabolism
MVDRQRPAKDLIRVIQILSSYKAFGVTVDNIAAQMEVSRLTAQRYLTA